MNTTEQPAVIIDRPRSDFLAAVIRGWRSLATALCAVFLFAGATQAKEPFDSTPYGKPTREDLPNGGYKEVCKNKKGERVSEAEFDGLGVQKSGKMIGGYHPNGQESQVTTGGIGIDSEGNTYLREMEDNDYDKTGKLTKQVVRKYDKAGNPTKKSVTTWPDGPNKPGVTKEYKWKEGDIFFEGEWSSKEAEEFSKRLKKTMKKFNRKKSTPRDDTSSTAPAENTASYFRAGEVELRAFAVYAVGNAQETVSHTVHETRTVVRDKTVKKVVLEDIPGKPGLTPVTKEFVEPTEFRETVSRREDTTVGPFGDHAFGAGIDAKYFPCRHVGIGVEGDWLRAENDAWSVFATITARCPIEGRCHIAPYVVAGIGGQFADDSRLVGMVGLGVEKRFSPSCGTFVEGRWLFDGNEQNVFELHVGVSMAFGGSDETPGENISIPHERGADTARSDSWRHIDPLAKQLQY